MCVAPLSGTRPIFENACMNEADADAVTISQHSAILAPAPAATPFTAATTGFFKFRMSDTRGLSCSGKILSIIETSAASERSWPAQKDLPLAVR